MMLYYIGIIAHQNCPKLQQKYWTPTSNFGINLKVFPVSTHLGLSRSTFIPALPLGLWIVADLKLPADGKVKDEEDEMSETD